MILINASGVSPGELPGVCIYRNFHTCGPEVSRQPTSHYIGGGRSDMTCATKSNVKSASDLPGQVRQN